MNGRTLRALGSAALALGLLACPKGSPVAPSGTVLTISANPSRIPVDGETVIIVTGRKPDGNPLSRDTEIQIRTTLGRLEVTIVKADGSGVARTRLFADGRQGTATVTANILSGGEGGASVEVIIGETSDTAQTVALTANPDRISVNGQAEVTAEVRNAGGGRAGAGIRVRFTTNLGRIDEFATTDGNGIARTTLRGDGRVGQATVRASTPSSPQTEIMISIGEAGSITLQANPSVVTDAGQQDVELVALVRDVAGDPLVGALVNYQAAIGSLASRGAPQATGADGVARDILTVTPSDIATLSGAREFTVTAAVPGASGNLITSTFRVQILRGAPIADFSVSSGGQFIVFFRNLTIGQEPLQFQWDFQSDGVVDSTARDPQFDYRQAIPSVTVTLRATNAQGADEVRKTFSVPPQ